MVSLKREDGLKLNEDPNMNSGIFLNSGVVGSMGAECTVQGFGLGG